MRSKLGIVGTGATPSAENEMLARVIQFFEISEKLRIYCEEALSAIAEEESSLLVILKREIKEKSDDLKSTIPEELKGTRLNDLLRHAHYGEETDFRDILNFDLPDIRTKFIEYVKKNKNFEDLSYADLLHPSIKDECLAAYTSGMYRNAALDAFGVILTYLRKTTGIELDGDSLITQTFSKKNPALVPDNPKFTPETKENYQRGAMNTLQGLNALVRNPLTHQRELVINQMGCARFMIACSLIMSTMDKFKLNENYSESQKV